MLVQVFEDKLSQVDEVDVDDSGMKDKDELLDGYIEWGSNRVHRR